MDAEFNFNINNMTADSLGRLPPGDVIKLALALKEENQKLLVLTTDELAKKYDERLERLERQLNLQNQYERRTSIELSGIPASVGDDGVEETVCD